MFIYNMSLLIIFWTLQQFVSFNFKTLYSFSDLKFNFYFVTALSVVLFSIAGVPPFLGFFSKLLILLALLNSNFFFFLRVFLRFAFFRSLFLLAKYSIFIFNRSRTHELRVCSVPARIFALLLHYLYYTFFSYLRVFLYGRHYSLFLLIVKLVVVYNCFCNLEILYIKENKKAGLCCISIARLAACVLAEPVSKYLNPFNWRQNKCLNSDCF